MKTALTILGLAVIAATMYYNLTVSQSTNHSSARLAYLKNTVQAQSEGGGAYADARSASGTSTVTHENSDGTYCTETYDFNALYCEGTGSVQCSGYFNTSNVQYSGDCPFH